MSGLNSLSRKFVGIIPPMSFQHLSYLKRLLLMFDSLALDLGRSSLSPVERKIMESARNEIDWLSNQGLLTTLGGLVAQNTDGVFPSRRSQPSVIGEDLLTQGLGIDPNLIGRVVRLATVATVGLRYSASELRSIYGVDAVAVPSKLEPQDSDATADRDVVIQIVLQEIPAPSDSTPWENIEDFRRDQKSRAEFSRLKQWINKMGKTGLKQYEVADELREIIYSYEERMKLHRIKAERGILEVLVTTTAEVAEGIVKFNWSTAAKTIFKARNYKLKLLEEEKETTGREVAYIVSAQRVFSK